MTIIQKKDLFFFSKKVQNFNTYLPSLCTCSNLEVLRGRKKTIQLEVVTDHVAASLSDQTISFFQFHLFSHSCLRPTVSLHIYEFVSLKFSNGSVVLFC